MSPGLLSISVTQQSKLLENAWQQDVGRVLAQTDRLTKKQAGTQTDSMQTQTAMAEFAQAGLKAYHPPEELVQICEKCADLDARCCVHMS